jgi:hypothetical protein
MWRRVGLVKTDVSEERVASIFGVKRNKESEVRCWRFSNSLNYKSKTHIPEDGIPHSDPVKTSNPT